MNLPIYEQIDLTSSTPEAVSELMVKDMNLKRPVVMNLKALNFEEQREAIGIIENYFATQEISYKFPYPVYLITDHEATITLMPVVKDSKFLPKFFSHRDTRTNMKENMLVSKNALLQQEVMNVENKEAETLIAEYADTHRKVYSLEQERLFYRMIIHRLTKVKKNG